MRQTRRLRHRRSPRCELYIDHILITQSHIPQSLSPISAILEHRRIRYESFQGVSGDTPGGIIYDDYLLEGGHAFGL